MFGSVHRLLARRGLLTGIYVLLAVPAVAIVAFTCWLYQDVYLAAQTLETQREAAAQNDVPTTSEEFARFSRSPASQDAAPILVRLAKDWQDKPEVLRASLVADLRDLATPAGAHPAEDKSPLERTAAVVVTVRKIAAFPDCVLPREWHAETLKTEPHYHAIVQIGRLVAARSVALARLGQTDTAFQDLDALRILGRHYARDGALDALGVHVLLENLALLAAVEAAVYSPDPNAPQRLRDFAADRSTQPDLLRAVQGEAVRSVSLLADPKSYDGRTYAGHSLRFGSPVIQRATAARMVEFWARAVPDVRGQTPDPIASRNAYAEAVKAFTSQRSPSRIVPSAVAAWFQNRVDAAATLETRYRLALAAADILAYQRQNNRLPARANDTKANLKDPCSGGSLAYEKTIDGFRVYSVGLDGKDNAGKPRCSEGADTVLAITAKRVSLEGG